MAADAKVLSNGIIYDLVYIQLTIDTQSDVNYKNIGSCWKGAFKWYHLWLGRHSDDNAEEYPYGKGCNEQELSTDGMVVSMGIIFDSIYIELTVHTHSDVNYKNIGSWWKGAFKLYHVWLGIHSTDLSYPQQCKV